MPWYSPWSDHIAKRVCKYLLQRYLGQFLEEKLTLDQLTVNLYKGIGTISNVALDVQALNDLAEQQNIPFQFMDGFIEEMSVSVPWSSILTEASYIEVRGLTLTVKHKERDKSRASMFESMWSSMTSSMQLAEDCLKNEQDGIIEDTNQSFEGIERFAQTIDSILSRIKVKFIKTIIRLEEIPPGSMTGVGLEVEIKSMDYFDEAGVEASEDVKQDFHLPAFSTKKLYLEGVCLYSDEFPVNLKLSSCDNDLLNEERLEEAGSETSNILIGRLAGRQEITMKFKQEGIAGPKVDLQVNLGALTIFMSPRQGHNMMDLINGMTSPSHESSNGTTKNRCSEKPMEESDFRKIEQELQMGLNPMAAFQTKGLGAQGWGNTSFDGSDDEFAPLHNMSKMNDSVMSSNASLSSSTSSFSSSKSSSSQSQQAFLPSKKKNYSGTAEADPNTAVFHFHVLLSSFAIVLLHDDVLTLSVESKHAVVTKSSFTEMSRLAEGFFSRLGHFAISGYGNKDFEGAKKIFLHACQRNHIRLLAAPVIIEGNETSTTHTSVIRGNCSAASFELLECLIEKETHSQKSSVEYVELLKFANHTNEDKKEMSHLFESQPNLKINFKLSQVTSKPEKGRRLFQPKSDFAIIFQPFTTEIDITIVDRISALLNPESFVKISNFTRIMSSSVNQKPFSKSHFEQAVESNTTLSTKQDIKITSPFITFKVRFPIPDLRPIHDMDKPPWWKRSVRQDILYLEVTDFSLHTVLDDQDTVSKYEMQFRDLLAKFKEADADSAVPFARASVDASCNTIMDGGQGFGWPSLAVHVYPRQSEVNLEESDLTAGHFKMHSIGHQSLVTTLENTTKRESSPFSCKKVVHESDTPHSKASSPDEMGGEELVIPGDKAEIADFIDVASVNTRIKLDISFPNATMLFASKHLFEVIYNRISSDLLLWEPSAPVRQTHHPNKSELNFQQSVAGLLPTFSLCKSGIQYDSDSDTESQEGLFYSVHEQKQRHRRRQLLEKKNLVGQSKVVIHLTIAQGVCDLFAPARDGQGNVIPGQHGQLYLSFEEGSLFLVSGYKGKSDLDYLCVQVNHFALYHNGLVSDTIEKPVLRAFGSTVPTYLDSTIYKTAKSSLIDQNTAVGTGATKSLDMLTVSVRVQKDESTHSLKMFRVATGIRTATLRHFVCNGQTSWFSQLIDFFDVDDYPIAGYEPSSVLTEINLHLWDCSIDYRPIYLPLRSVLTVGNFNISSNIAAQTSSSTLRFIAEDAAFFISDKAGVRFQNAPIDLKRDYICVVDLGLFELSLRLCEKNQVHPKVDLRASTNVAHIRTCADSAKAITELLMYFASDGDLTFVDVENEEFERSNTTMEAESEEHVLVNTIESENVHILSKSQVALVNDLMEEAMKESKVESASRKGTNIGGEKIVYFEQDEHEEGIGQEKCLSLGSVLTNECHGDDFGDDSDDKDDSWEKEFYILGNEAGIGILPKKGLPEVRNLTNAPVRLVDNHFSIPLGKADLLRSPKHYPKPVLRYMLREMSVVWHMYGGSDFDNSPSLPVKHVKIDHNLSGNLSDLTNSSGTTVTFSKTASGGVRFESSSAESAVPWKERGGSKRRHDILMELQLNKVRFQHEVYPDNTTEASRQVLLIQELEWRDRLATSHINKFLYQYSSEAKPKQSQAPMVMVKSVLMRSDPKVNAQECCLKVSLLPLRLNIDQDSVLFLYNFFNEISGDNKEEEEDPSSRVQTPTHQVPVMSVNVKSKTNPAQPEPQHLLIQLDEEAQRKCNATSKNKRRGFTAANKPPSPPVFFRCFIFSPEVPVKLDYQGKRVDMSHGPLAGILMGLGQLNNSELRLRKISHRHGLLGFDKLLNFVLSEWTADIKKNQLPSLLGGVGPMHSLVQLIQGIRDLFWLPIEQYQRDGRLVRGFQRGANSFTTSTAMACLELTSRVIQIIQSTAETAYDMVSPGPSVRNRRTRKGRPRRYSQPADIREGVTNAYNVVKEGIGETAETIVRIASEEHEQKGMTGAVGGVLRQIPPTMVKPIILATEATNNVIGGMRSQLVPDARKEAVEKWRKHDL